MPIGILGSLAICTVLYILFAHVLTGIAPVEFFRTTGKEASVAQAINTFMPGYAWLAQLVTVAILAGFSSVILVMLLGQSRVFYSMSRDGLMPKIFSDVHPKFKTPYKANLIFLAVVGAFAAFVPGDIVGDMTSIGTLFAFMLVCAAVMILRKTDPDMPRAFKTPMVPLVPILGIATCLFMMVFLPMDTWIRLLVWMLIGLDIYLVYGAKNSHLGNGSSSRKGMKMARTTGIALAGLLVIVGFLHQNVVGFSADRTLLYISLGFAVIHAGLYASKLGRSEDKV